VTSKKFGVRMWRQINFTVGLETRDVVEDGNDIIVGSHTENENRFTAWTHKNSGSTEGHERAKQKGGKALFRSRGGRVPRNPGKLIIKRIP